MLLPFETSLGMWFAGVPCFEWEPVPPGGGAADAIGALGPDDAPAAQADSAAKTAVAATSTLPAMRLVFKGVQWVAYPVWRVQDNPAWDLAAQNRRDEADQHGLERARHARRTLPPKVD